MAKRGQVFKPQFSICAFNCFLNLPLQVDDGGRSLTQRFAVASALLAAGQLLYQGHHRTSTQFLMPFGQDIEGCVG